MLQEEALNQAITNPLYEISGRRNVLQAVIDNLDISKTMKSFLLLLFDKGRIGFVDRINEFYQKLADELNGIARASLVSATDLSDDTVEKIRAALSKKTNKEIILEVEQDPALIGGIVTKIGDLVWDGSIKTQLSNMRETLKRGEGV
jgi:F-type H+-transporting ATPase subunit delta